MRRKILQMMLAMFVCVNAHAQINTGSTGSDGALDYSSLTNSTNIVIDMHDHPNGIYQYTYVTIPNNVTVTFIPNGNNTPLTWLVQSNVLISGTVNICGQSVNGVSSQGGVGGPGGYQAGNGVTGGSATSGQGPGGGTDGAICANYNYGNQFLIPLLGGSGGGGAVSSDLGNNTPGGGGGGGAILIAASSSIAVVGSITAIGGFGTTYHGGQGGSGGAIRLVASKIFGNGQINVSGGSACGGPGRIRFDTYDNEFTGSVIGQFSSGFQPIIIPSVGQLPQLTVTSVGGVPGSASPTGVLSTPDAVLSAQQNNPIPIVVSCTNLPLNSLITVSITPANGSPVSATGYNTTGTLSSSTATISIVIPRGGGLIYATAATSN
jgi:hypothetical protein